MNNQTGRRCRSKKPNGVQCEAKAMVSSDYCFFHCPEVAVERTKARRAGGCKNKAAVLPSETPDCPLSSGGDVILLIADCINQIRRGQLDPRVGNAIGYLSGVLLKAIETGNLERRLADLESAVTNQPAAGQSFDWDKFEFVQAPEKDQ